MALIGATPERRPEAADLWYLALSARVGKDQAVQAGFAFERFPLTLRLGQPVCHCPPGTGVQTDADMAGDDFQMFSVRVDLARRLDACAPGHDAVGARKH